MLKSKEIRAKAWDSLKGKYGKALLATIIVSLVVSLPGLFTLFSDRLSKIIDAIKPDELDKSNLIDALSISGAALLLAFVALFAGFFIGNIASLGCCNYFIKNTDSKPSLFSVFSGFKKRYGRNVKTLILRDIKLVLWSLLLVVPGIIKSIEYSIIPYILADDNEISSKDAFKKAKQMMKGNKWRAFKLDLSFIGWYFLCIFTFGIGAFFLVPYVEAANAEFYVELKNK